jgi:hypothetical protein
MGSDMHVNGFHLGLALEQGRVFLVRSWTVGHLWTDDVDCGGNRGFNQCVFRRPTHCKVEDMAEERTTTAWGAVVNGVQGISSLEAIPSHLRAMLKTAYPSMSTMEIKYWWRGACMRAVCVCVKGVRRRGQASRGRG